MDCMQVSIPIMEYSENENSALELIDFLISNDDVNTLGNILKEIIDNVAFNQGKDVVGIVNDYEYKRY